MTNSSLPLWTRILIPMSACLAVGVIAHADNMSGYVFHTSSGYILSPSQNASDPSAEPLLAPDSSAAHTLSLLSNGDSIVGVGVNENGTWTANEIDFVSLSSLLGAWSGGGVSLNFVNNTTAIGILPSPIGSGSLGTYSYSIVPTQDSSWRLLLSDGSSTHIGKMVINSSGLSLQFFDASTGALIVTLALSSKSSNF